MGAFSLDARAQVVGPIKLHVVDARTGRPVPYASVGVRGKPQGTVADAQGVFPLAQVGAEPTDTVVISCVGYVPRKLPAGQLRHETTLRLAPQPTALAEVLVRSRAPRPVVLGHRSTSIFTSFNFYTQADTVPHARLGREMGVLLNVRHPTELHGFHVFTFGRDFATVTFRLNIYAVAGGLPGETLLRRDIVFDVDGRQRGWTTVDLRPYALALPGGQPVVATIEWLANVPRLTKSWGVGVGVPGHVSATHSTFSRDKSAQNWKKMAFNPSMYFTGLAYPE